MSYGISGPNFANALLNTIPGTNFVVPATWIQLHTGDPGAPGTANLSVVTTRQQAAFAAASGGAIALSAAPQPWLMTATETITAISIWTAATGGLVLWDCLLAASQAVSNGDTLTLNTCGLSLGPLSV
jgi:hypothetical protein